MRVYQTLAVVVLALHLLWIVWVIFGVLVTRGRPTLRHPEGEDVLAPGDVVCFPEGPEGAHKLTNNESEPVRVILLSDKPSLAVAVYPDSDKIGVYPGDERDKIMVRRESGVEYFDREV